MTAIAIPSEGWDIASIFHGTTPPSHPMLRRIGMFGVSAARISVPPVKTRSAPEAQVQANYLIRFSGLSRRSLSDVLGITHPTLGALIDGSNTQLAKKPEAKDRLARLYDLCTRIAPLADYDSQVVAKTLFSSTRGMTVALLAAEGDLTTSYLTALNALSPRQSGLERQSFASREEGSSTVAL